MGHPRRWGWRGVDARLICLCLSLLPAAAAGKERCEPRPDTRRSVLLTALPPAAEKALRPEAAEMVAVADTSCGFEVLPTCRVAVRTPFVPEAIGSRELPIASPEKLLASLPTASRDLRRAGKALARGTIRMATIGRRSLARPVVFAAELVGDCEAATHVVSQLVYGALEVHGPPPDALIYDAAGDLPACGEPIVKGKGPPADCRSPVSATLTRVAPNVLVAPYDHDPDACKADDVVDCTQSCALGDASGCTSLAHWVEKTAEKVKSTAEKVDRETGAFAAEAKEKGVTVTPAPGVQTGAKAAAKTAGQVGPEVASALYGAACLAGRNLACNNLGVMAERGRGMAPDPALAAVLYQAACDGGLPRACSNLGTLYRDGKGRKVSLPDSLRLFQKACTEGDPAACVNLGQQQLVGLGMPKNVAAALESFRRGCEAGESLGCKGLTTVAGLAEHRGKAEGALKLACEKGVQASCAVLERVSKEVSDKAGEEKKR